MEKICHHKQKREVTIYMAATIITTWLFWLPAFLVRNSGFSLPPLEEVLLKLGSFVPSALGIALSFAFEGKEEVRHLFKSLINIHINRKCQLYIFLPLAISSVALLIYLLLGGHIIQPVFPLWLVPVAFLMILTTMGPLGEEAGWRGFALKRIISYSSPFNASLLLGIIWSVWHLPLFFIRGTTQYELTLFGLLPSLLGYLLYTVMMSVLITILYCMSCGNVLGAVLFHTMSNMSLGIAPLIFQKAGAVILLLVMFLASIGLTYKHRQIMCNKDGWRTVCGT